MSRQPSSILVFPPPTHRLLGSSFAPTISTSREVTERQTTGRTRCCYGRDGQAVQVKFCVDAEWIESLIDLGILDNVTSYDELTDDQLQTYFDKKAEESKEVLSLEKLDDLVAKQLRINMSDSAAKFALRLSLSHTTHSYVAMASNRSPIWNFPIITYARTFKGSYHAIKLSEAFQLVDNGAPTGNKTLVAQRSSAVASRATKRMKILNRQPNRTRIYPFSSMALTRPKVTVIYFETVQPAQNTKKSILKARLDEKAKTGLSKPTRAQNAALEAAKNAFESEDSKVTGRLEGQSAT
eukprot:IDg4017t1